jgi:hypothetical protein
MDELVRQRLAIKIPKENHSTSNVSLGSSKPEG